MRPDAYDKIQPEIISALSGVETCYLVEELKKREDVVIYKYVDPEETSKFVVNGAAIVLIVTG